MNRPSRSTKGQCSQNYEDFDDELMKRARSLSWLFVNKGDLQPIVIPYNSVMWPTGMTVREKLNLEKKPAKTKITLQYEGKPIECSLTGVVANTVIDGAIAYVHKRMLDAGGALSDVSLHENQTPSKTLANVSTVASDVEEQGTSVSKKRPSASPAKTKSKKVIKVIPSKLAESAYEPVLSFEQTDVNDDSNDVSQISLNPQMEDFSDELVKLIETKMRRLIAVHEEHARKISLENNRFRSRFAELLRKQKGDHTIEAVVPQSSEPLIFNSLDLMSLKPVGGPSSFGRLLAATIFGAESSCDLITQRLDIKATKNNCRKAADPEKESLFKECVGRFFPNESNKAVREAIRGANQYGTDMKTKYSHSGDENSDPNDL